MRGTIGVKLQNSTISNSTRISLVPFSTSSNFGRGGDGRGRGGPISGRQFNSIEKAPGNPNSSDSKSDSTDSPIPPSAGGRGHGRGGPNPPPTGFPSFSSFMNSIKQPSIGRGRGFGPSPPQSENDTNQQQQPEFVDKKPIFFRRDEGVNVATSEELKTQKKSVFTGRDDVRPIDLSGDNESDKRLSMDVLGVLSGAGRGKPIEPVEREIPKVTEENRHIRNRRTPEEGVSENISKRQPMLSQDDARNNARKYLSKDDGERSSVGRERDSRERGGFVRGRGRGVRGRGRGRGGFRGGADDRMSQAQGSARSNAAGLDIGNNADGERLAKKVGPEIMKQLTDEFEEMASRVLPSPLEDEYVEAYDINCAIEFEPEYAVEFDNPDIDEKEPISLRDALEKMKPFLMKYEGIQSQEEWEEIMGELMERVPLLKEIVDHYSGPDRVTAKKQQEELERVAKTLPQSAPASVKQFTNRAVISLQSNPGWGFDKKCQFMDKLVFEVSQHHK